MEASPERTNSKLEWFFFIFILPVLFISLLAFILLWFLDYDLKENVFASLNQVPVIEKIIPDGENSKPVDSQTMITNLQKAVNQKDQSVLQLEAELKAKEEEMLKLQQRIEGLEQENKTVLLEEEERIEDLKKLAKVYENMSAKNAAKILEELSYEEAVLIFGQMGLEPKSKILEKMDPKKSADLSVLLKEQNYSKEQDIAALQQRIEKLVHEIDLLRENDVQYQELAITFSTMNPENAANTLVSIADTNPKLVYQILAAMENQSRSIILNQVDENFSSAKAAEFTMGISEVKK